MATRRNIGGRYVEVRERNTSKGHRGTIMKNWSSKKQEEGITQTNNFWGQLFIVLIILILLIFVLYYLLK